MNPNKYSGFCACGTHVPAEAGVFIAGLGIRCSSDLHATETNGLAHACANQIAVYEAHKRRISENPALGEQITQNTKNKCGKCAGTGTYRYSDGDLGVCYSCDGTGHRSKAAS